MAGVRAGAPILIADQQDGSLATIGDVWFVRKSASEDVTSSTSLQDDNHLQVTLPIGTFSVECFLHAEGVEGGDIRVAWSRTGTMTISRTSIGPDSSMFDRESTNLVMRGNLYDTEQIYGVDTTGVVAIHESMNCAVTASGVLQLQWAQGTSDGTATTLSIASRLYVRRVE
jgi:hypothetical protein